jgi:fimbrial isopeptide formation D2 family protein
LRVEQLESRDNPAPLPTIQGLTANQNVFLGENVNYSFSFTNTGPDPGFGPYIVVAMDTSGVDGATAAPFDGLASPTAPPLVTSTGLTLTPLADLPYSTTFTNPFTGASESAPTGSFGANDRLYVYQLPFISMTAGQTTGLTISAPLSNLADLGSPLPIAIKPVFRDDNATAPFNVIAGAQANTTVTPILYTLTKTYLGPEDETATGPNFIRRYRLDIDIAPGQTLTNLRVTDDLAATMQIVGINTTNMFASTAAGGLGTNTFAAGNLSGTAITTAPDGTLIYNFGNVTGVAGVDARFEFDFFVPRDNSAGNEILPQPTPPGPDPAGGTNSITDTNTASSAASWTPIDTRDATQAANKAAPDNGPHTLQEHSVAVQKSVTALDLTGAPLPINPALGVPVIQPGFTLLRYDLDFQVSDYYAVNNLFLEDILGDGMRLYIAGGFTPTLTVNNAWTFSGGGTRAATTSGAFGGANTIDYSRRYSLSGNTDRTPSNGIEGYAETGATGGVYNLLAPGTIDGTTFLRFNISQELIARGLPGLLVGGEIANGGGNPQNLATPPFGGATGRVTFYALVKREFADDFPSADRSVDQGDLLTNSVPLIQGSHLSPTDLSDGTPTALGTVGTDDSGTSVVIPYGSREKMIHAINGQTIPAQGPTDRINVQAGDLVTYRLTYTLPISSFENLQLIDFPPLPVMPVAGSYTFIRDPAAYAFAAGTVGVYDPAGSSAIDDTYFATFDPGLTGGRNPTITPNASTNTVTMDFGSHDDPQRRFTTISLLITFQVANNPFASDLPLTNQLRINEDSTNQGATTVEAIRQFELVVPNVGIQKGVVGFNTTGLTLGGVAFTAPGTAPAFTVGGNPPSGTNSVNSSAQANAVGARNGTLADGIDAGDTVRFAIVAQNSGQGDAFDVVIQDTVQAQFDRTTFANLRVYRGDGTLLVNGTDYTSTYNNVTGALQITLIDNYTAGNVGGASQDPRSGGLSRGAGDQGAITNGSNTVIVLYDVTLANTVTPNLTITNTAVVASYSNAEGGSDLTDPSVIPGAVDPQDTANVVVALPLVNKTLVGTELTEPGNNAASQAVVGELVTYTVTVTIPEGTTPGAVIVDTLEAGLAFVDVTGVTTTSGLSVATPPGTGTAPANVTITNTGRTITFNLGDVTNNTNPNNAGTETITITYRAVVLNTLANQSGQTRNNSAEFEWTNNTTTLPGVPAGHATNSSGSLTGTATPVTIVEPLVTPAKTVANISNPNGTNELVRADAGDTVEYTIVLTASGTTAFDVTLNDVLPAQLTSPTVFSATSSGTVRINGASGTVSTANFVITGGALTFVATDNIDMESGATITVVVRGVWSGAAGSIVPNTAEVRWTSLDGTPSPSPRSSYDPASVERGGQDGPLNGGALNDYRTLDGASVESPTIVRKTIVATSEPGTTPVAAHPTAGGTADRTAIGEVVRYRLYASVAEGLSRNFQIADFLPAGIQFLNDGSARYVFVSNGVGLTSASVASVAGLTTVTATGNGGTLAGLTSASITGTFADSNIATSNTGAGTGDPVVYASGQDVFFRFGSLTNADNDTDAEFVVLEFNALVDNTAGNQAGTGLINNFGVLIDTNNDDTPGFVDVAVDTTGTGVGGATVSANDPTNNGSGTPALSNDVVVTVVEPNVQITKQVIATTGGTVTYRLVVTNTGANASQANEVNIFDQLNATNFSLNLGSVTITLAGGAAGSTNNSSGNRVDVNVATLPVGGTVTIDYTANVLVTPTGTTTLNNTANTTGTSLTGDNGFTGNFFGTVPGTLGLPGSGTGERTGSGGINDYVASANQSLGSLGDRVYFDADADGVQDAGEAGIVGVPVTVRWAGPNGTFGDSDDSVIVVNTGANGAWTITGLPVGAGQNYRVSVPTTFSGMNLTDVRDNGGAANIDPDALGAGISAISLTGADAGTTNNRIQDFGYRGTASLGDRIYLDTNGNGVQDANGLEPGLPGVTVTLEWAGADGDLTTTADNLTFTTVSTATAGTTPNFLFPNLPSGNFRVTVSGTSGTGGVPDNVSLTDSVDNGGAADATASVTTTLTTGQNRTDQDFGYRGTASIGDFVWYDADGDGVQDTGEPGIAGATVTLLWAGPDGTLGNADDVTFTTTTDASGLYLFPNLPVNGADDPYRVTVAAPAAYPTQTFDNDGLGTANQSTHNLGQTENNRVQDFGYRGTAQLGNFVWEDLNANGRQDGGEPGINGVTVNLYFDANNNGTFESGELATPLLTTVTAGGGLYSFPNLAAGNYRVQFGTLAGYVRTTTDSTLATDTTDSDANDSTGFTGNYTLTNGADDQTVDAGLYRLVSLGDRVYFDYDADGVQDANEPGIPGVGITVVWLGPDGALGGGDDQTFNTTTGANGIWSVTNLPPGNFQVTATPFAGLDVLTDSLDNGGAPNATNPVSVSTNSGVNRIDVDFGFRGVGSVGDTIFLDVDNNGLPNTGEGLANVVVTLSGDLNGDGSVAANETLTTTTNGVGFYQFTGLRTNTAGVPYTVTVVTSTLPQDGPGTPIPNTVDPDGGLNNTSSVTITTAAPSNQAQDFGYRNTTSGIIGDTVFLDVDGDGAADAGEGITGVRVELSADFDGNGTTETFTQTTSATGNYRFDNLPIRTNDGTLITYTVTVNTIDLPPGVNNSVDPDGGANSTSTLTLDPSNPVNLNQDFGYQGNGSIGDRVFLDLNNNGVWDAGEGITVPVVLTADVNADGLQDLNLTVTTDADGFYLFDNLPEINPNDQPIAYTVTVVTAQLPAGVSNTVDPDGTTDSTWSGTLTTGPGAPDRRDIDFGYRGTGSLGDRIWFDSNGDTVQDPTALEPGIPFVEVSLTYAGQDGVLGNADDVFTTITSDAAGFYRFDHLPAGNFRVNLTPATLPGNLTPTFDQDGTGTPDTAVATLTTGQNRTDVDFGYRGTASLGDRVWLDQNRNGVQDPSEFGVIGAVVQLTMAGPDGQLGSADDIVYTTTTAAIGIYSFPGLPVYGRIGDSFRVDVTSVPGIGALVPISDLDSAPVTGDQTATGTLGPNQNRTDVDFGYDSTGSISGTVFLDPNNNGLQTVGESGIAGVTLILSGTDVFGNPIVDPITGGPLTTTTDANGNYLFDTLLPGTYTVQEVQPNGLLDGIDTPGTTGGTAGQGAADTDTIQGIILPGGASLQNNFAEIPPASITGTVYEDRNRNRNQDPNEPGIPNVVVVLTGTDDRGSVTRTVTTDANGNYTFDNLRPGTYTLTETQPGGFAQSGNAVGNAGGTEPRRDVISGIVLVPGQTGQNYLFGEVRRPATLVVPPAPVFEPSKQQFLSSSNPIPATNPNYTPLGSVDPNAPVQFVVTGEGPNGQLVRVFDTTAGVERFRFAPFAGFAGGVRAATADVNADGIPDIIVGAGPTGGPRVQVYDGNTGQILQDFFAFESFFRGGVFVSGGDFNGDGQADVVVSADVGGGPRVRVFSAGNPNVVLSDFFGIADANFRGGARIAVGDINADGVVDLVVAAGVGGGPRVATYDGRSIAAGTPTTLFHDFFAFEPFLRNGAYVAVGDVDGDGFGDLIAGAGEGGGPRVTAFSGAALLQGNTSTWVANFFAFDPATTGGVRVAAADLNRDGRVELFVGTGPNLSPRARFINPLTGGVLNEFAPDWTDRANGIFVG